MNMRIKVVMVMLGAVALFAAEHVTAEPKELAARLLEAMGEYERNHYRVSFELQRKLLAQGIKISDSHYPPTDADRATAALRYAEENGIPLEDVLAVAKAQVKASYAELEVSYPHPLIRNEQADRRWTFTGEGSPSAVMRFQWMLGLLVAAGDLSSLPLIDEAHSTLNYPWVREASACAYIRLAGADSVPFIRRLMADNRYTGSSFSPVLSLYLKEFRKATGINDEPLVFLCELAEKGENITHAAMADEELSKTLPGYSTSVQRLSTARRFAPKDASAGTLPNHDFRKKFHDVKEEIEQIPESERKDFRAKGELLDPERRKAP